MTTFKLSLTKFSQGAGLERIIRVVALRLRFLRGCFAALNLV